MRWNFGAWILVLAIWILVLGFCWSLVLGFGA